jgi:hypothetical protein
MSLLYINVIGVGTLTPAAERQDSNGAGSADVRNGPGTTTHEVGCHLDRGIVGLTLFVMAANDAHAFERL